MALRISHGVSPWILLLIIKRRLAKFQSARVQRDFKDEAETLSTKMAPSFDCACLATLHALTGGASLVQLIKTDALAVHLKANTTALTKKGKVVNGKCVCK